MEEIEYQRVRIEIERLVDTSYQEESSSVKLELPAFMVDDMIDHAISEHPNMCCGTILGKDGQAEHFARARNEESSPYRYSIAADDLALCLSLADDNDWSVMAIYSSRPQPKPSYTDFRQASWPWSLGEPIYPHAFNVFISVDDPLTPIIRAFQLDSTSMSERPVDVHGVLKTHATFQRGRYETYDFSAKMGLR